MSHLHMSYEEVMNAPLLNVSLYVSESTPRFDRDKDDDDDTVEIDTYYGKVKAKKQFII